MTKGKLIFIYGPPAAGKLTVATELAKLSGYKLLDNHRVIDYLTELFPREVPEYQPIRSSLGRKVRLDIFSAAAQAHLQLITTFAPLSEGMQDFMRDVCRAVEAHGGEICFVQLLPSRETLLERVTGEPRINKKIDTAERWHEVVANTPGAFETFPDVEHCVIDNSDLTPVEAAKQIIKYYQLSQ
jgi:hypothetical protein